MKDVENFDDFYAKFNNIVDSVFNLGKKMKDLKVVDRIIMSLLKSFQLKVVVMEESKIIDKLNWMSWLEIYKLMKPITTKE